MKKLPAFPFSIRPPSRLLPENLMQELEAALDAQDFTHALEVLDSAPRWMKNEPELKLFRALMLSFVGNHWEAIRIVREMERKNRHFTAIYLPLAILYMEQDWPAHALQAAKRALSDRGLPDESKGPLLGIIAEATESIQEHANKYDLSFETMFRAGIYNEQAQMASNENKLSEAEYYAREAVKLAPNWNPPHNNRARALYFSGKTAEAIAVAEAVLARDPENFFALDSLVTFHTGLDQTEQARGYANRLAELSKKISKDSLEIEHVISALALLEDTTALWSIAKRYLAAPPDYLYDRSWYSLGVAAIRSGKWKDAQNLFRKMDEEDSTPAEKTLIDEVETVAGQSHPRLAWMPPAYPGVDLLLHPSLFAEWEVIFRKSATGPVSWSPSQKRKVDSFFLKYPFVFAAMKRMMWNKETNPVALDILLQMETPEADAEVLRFASSQTGDHESRMQAVLNLLQTGRYTGSKYFNIWFEDLEEWHEVELNSQQVGDIDLPAQPKTLALIEKAMKAKDPQESIALLRKAVELEPTSPIAIFNLGVVLTQNGQVEEGRDLIEKSVIVDPNYTFGHASIALTKAFAGDDQEAAEHLMVVSRAELIAPQTAFTAWLAQSILAIHKHDLKAARAQYQMAAEMFPGHQMLKAVEEMLDAEKEFKEKYGFLIDYQQKSAQRSHQKLMRTPLTPDMGLQACLETNIKEMLVGIAHFLRTSSSGKKGELAAWLAENLLDEEFLKETLDEDLDEKERAALKWVLDAGGVMPWKDFTRRYGSDIDESVLWNYHEPQSMAGRLRRSGLLFSGTLEGQEVFFIPADVRPLLRKLL